MTGQTITRYLDFFLNWKLTYFYVVSLSERKTRRRQTIDWRNKNRRETGVLSSDQTISCEERREREPETPPTVKWTIAPVGKLRLRSCSGTCQPEAAIATEKQRPPEIEESRLDNQDQDRQVGPTVY